MLLHGEYSIEALNKCLIVKAVGGFNAETMVQYSLDFKENAKSLSITPHWSVLIDGIEWELDTPETVEEISQLQLWCMKYNQTENLICY